MRRLWRELTGDDPRLRLAFVFGVSVNLALAGFFYLCASIAGALANRLCAAELEGLGKLAEYGAVFLAMGLGMVVIVDAIQRLYDTRGPRQTDAEKGEA